MSRAGTGEGTFYIIFFFSFLFFPGLLCLSHVFFFYIPIGALMSCLFLLFFWAYARMFEVQLKTGVCCGGYL